MRKLLMVLTSLFFGHWAHAQKHFDVKNSHKILERILKSHLVDKSITPVDALVSILDFYKNYLVNPRPTNADDDMLLFEYGSYDWDGKGEKFELSFTRQIADPKSDEFYQARMTLYYRPQDIKKIENFNLWSIDKKTIDLWAKTVSETVGYIRALTATPINYTVELTKT